MIFVLLLVASFLTAFYIFRVVFLVFFGGAGAGAEAPRGTAYGPDRGRPRRSTGGVCTGSTSPAGS